MGKIVSPGGAIKVGIGGASISYGAVIAPNPDFPPGPASIGILRLADSYDPIVGSDATHASYILQREYWGVAAGAVSGYIDPNGTVLPHNKNTVLNSAIFNANDATISTYLNDGSGNILQVDHVYTFPKENVLLITATITNLSGSSQAILYRRGVDWDIRPFQFGGSVPTETVAVPPWALPVVDATVQDTSPSADPLVAFGADSTGAGGGNYGPLDLGSGMQLDLGTLANGAAVVAKIFYGINNPSTEGAGGLALDMASAGATWIMVAASYDGSNSAALGTLAVPVSPGGGAGGRGKISRIPQSKRHLLKSKR